jgi:hypothetical protein
VKTDTGWRFRATIDPSNILTPERVLMKVVPPGGLSIDRADGWAVADGMASLEAAGDSQRTYDINLREEG